jgi:CheY-like chemotaxis protein
MPEIDGYEATGMIRRHEQEHAGPSGRTHLPIIAVTAVAIQGARERCLEAGMDDYLSKPVIVQSVVDVLNRWVGRATVDAAWDTVPADATAIFDVPSLSDEDVVDRAALDALRELDSEAGDALVAEMIQDFAAEVVPRMRGLHVAAACGDAQAVLQDLHFVAGCASIVGAVRVERLARSLEAKGPLDVLGGPHGAMALAAQLEEEVLRARSVLESIVAASA